MASVANASSGASIRVTDRISGCAQSAAEGRMGSNEFILLIAALMSMIALSVDLMLPALPRIEAALPGAAGAAGESHGEYVIFALILGMAITPLPVGLAADAYGRRAPLLAALALYALGSVLCAAAWDFESLLFGRFLQGAGVVGPRIVAQAVVRDRYSGSKMAKVMSIVMMIFIAVPAIAPALGLGVELLAGWRSLFVTLGCLAVALIAWIVLRLPETLAEEHRRPIKPPVVLAGLRAILARRRAIGAILASGLFFTPFLAFIGTSQHVLGEIYGFGDAFVFVFSFNALFIGASSFLNSRIVERVGVRGVLDYAVRAMIFLCAGAGFVFSLIGGAPPFALYATWCALVAFVFGLAFANINALAMHYMGDLAGLGAAALTTMQNLIAAVGAAVISGMMTDDPTPIVVSFFVCGSACLVLLVVSNYGPPEEHSL
ncbi:MAG: MFS transporter [Neomegalonema sp.]|nr:MFS transporter [Neomegalonema sp.]